MAGDRSVTVSRVIPASQEDVWRILDNTVFGPVKGNSRWRVVERDTVAQAAA